MNVTVVQIKILALVGRGDHHLVDGVGLIQRKGELGIGVVIRARIAGEPRVIITVRQVGNNTAANVLSRAHRGGQAFQQVGGALEFVVSRLIDRHLGKDHIAAPIIRPTAFTGTGVIHGKAHVPTADSRIGTDQQIRVYRAKTLAITHSQMRVVKQGVHVVTHKHLAVVQVFVRRG